MSPEERDFYKISMTDQQHPLTPPSELVEQWKRTAPHRVNETEHYHYITLCAAQWGADQELKACCHYFARDLRESLALELRAARRPKPPTLNSIALQMLGTIERDAHYLPEITDTIRKALEQLND